VWAAAAHQKRFATVYDKVSKYNLNIQFEAVIIFYQGEHMSDYTRTFNQEAKIKLTQLINEGMTVMQEIEDLNAGLNDTIKAIAEELEIKPATLKKAVKIAHKSKLGETNRDHDELNTILETVGKTL
jgi:transposase-like protein